MDVSIKSKAKSKVKAGLDGFAASLVAYWRESFSLRKCSDGSSASAYKLVTGEVRNAPKAKRSSGVGHLSIIIAAPVAIGLQAGAIVCVNAEGRREIGRPEALILVIRF